MTGIEVFLEILARAGVRHIFGNPGTTELPLSAALAHDPRFRYILGLHEIPVLAAADGYAQASGHVGVACVHISCGLGNALGMLYNSYCAGTPLLLLAGQQDRRLNLQEPVLAGDLVTVARPWTKWAFEVQRPEDVAQATRRAIQTALTAPRGPVFLALPLDLQLADTGTPELAPPCIPNPHMLPPFEELKRAARLLAHANNPVILAGSRVTQCRAVVEMVALAEQLGAPVITECATSHGRLAFPPAHPLFSRELPLWSEDVHKRLAPFDVALVVGMSLLRQYLFEEPVRPIPEHLQLIQLDNDPWQLAKNYPVAAALPGDIKAGLAELTALVSGERTMTHHQIAHARQQRCHAEQRADRESLAQTLAAEQHKWPMTPLTLMSTVARVLPPGTAVIEEAPTTTNRLLERLGAIDFPEGYFGPQGWALGWGLGCALGVKLAWPGRPVVCLLGDGAALYGIQGLWTAAHEHIPVTFIICNNRQYRILKDCAVKLPLGNVEMPGMDLVRPEIDFVGLAQSLGVRATRIAEPGELAERLSASLAADQPQILDVPLAQ
jgi:benzoylformate decarboxylase